MYKRYRNLGWVSMAISILIILLEYGFKGMVILAFILGAFNNWTSIYK